MRATALFMPTVKEDPADAEAISHKLLVRGGFVRQFASGIYVFLPLGWKVINRICGLIREEMNAIGAQELSMPTLHPADVWQETGRYEAIGAEMFRFRDRGGRDMVLAMTHEEVFAWLVSRELRSYKELPQIWYQIQLKFRDEPRSKGGILRVREFLMKDSYSFDVDEDGLEESYAKHVAAYSRIFKRSGIEFYQVESDTGIMGGAGAHEYMAPSPAGEDKMAYCVSCGYAANVELARSTAAPPVEIEIDSRLATTTEVFAPTEVFTPGQKTIEEVSAFLNIKPHQLIKSLVYIADKKPVMALVRGDHTLHENKLARYLHAEVKLASSEEIQAALGVELGFVGPVSAQIRIIADEALLPGPAVDNAKNRVYTVGANKADTHLHGVVVGRDFVPEYADLREVEEGDACPNCGTSLTVKQVIEVGNIFKLGTKYTKPLKATILDESSKEQFIVMGSYGIGPARIAAAAVEQSHDERGIIWPKSIAPFDVHLIQVNMKDEIQLKMAKELYEALRKEGWDVLWDDREQRPGFKFADAELIGCPVRITVGKKAAEGIVEIEPRTCGLREEVPLDVCVAAIQRLWKMAY